MEPSPPVFAKKLCKMVRVVFFMIEKGVTKSNLMGDLHLMMQRGKIVGKALNDLMLHHYSTLRLSCRSHDMHASFVSPREYEFSCSDSPAYQPYIPTFHVTKRRGHCSYTTHHKHHVATVVPPRPPTSTSEDGVAVSDRDVAEDSPLVHPVRRRVRVTDSPFPLWDDDKDCHVDKEAEEFIQRFYKQLRLQKAASHCG